MYSGSINSLQMVTVKYTPADYVLRFVSGALALGIVNRFKPEYEEWLE
ncbi:hypothetical protein [Infirmifilum sp.]